MARRGRIALRVSRRELLRRAAGAGLAAAAGGAFQAGWARPAAAQTTQKRDLIIAQGGDISRFDSHMSTSSTEIRASFNLFDNLTSRHPDGRLFPALATQWKRTDPT